MTRLQERNLASGLFAFGGGLLAVASVRDQVKPSLPGWVDEKWFLYGTFAGLAIILIASLLWLHSRTIPLTLNAAFNFRVAKAEDLPLIRALAAGHFGEDISSLPALQAWHKQNSQSFLVLFKEFRSRLKTSSEIVGYFIVLPLKKDGVARLRRGEFTGANIPADAMSKGRRPAALYIGGVAANGFRARGEITRLLKHDLTRYWNADKCECYTKPVTRDGLKMSQEHGFRPADENESSDVNILHRRPPSK